MKAENIEINANDVEMLQLIPLEENIYRSKIIIKIEKIIKRFIDIWNNNANTFNNRNIYGKFNSKR